MPVRCHSTSRPSRSISACMPSRFSRPMRVELVDLVGPARLSVLVTVGQAGVDESAVASRRGPADAVGLDQHDALVRIALCGVQRGPQPGVAAADDQQVAGDRARSAPGYSGRSMSSHIDPKVLAASDRSTSAGSTSPIEHGIHVRTLPMVGTMRTASRGDTTDAMAERSTARDVGRASRGPPGRSEDVAEAVAQPAGPPDVAGDRHVLVGLQLPDVVRVDLLGQPVVRSERSRRRSCRTAGPTR